MEELAGGRDFRASVSRETLEELAGDWFSRAVAPLTTLLERNHLVRDDVRIYLSGYRASKRPNLVSTNTYWSPPASASTA